MAKWADLPEIGDIREAYDRLEEINRLQAKTIERQAEQLRQAQQRITALQAAQERRNIARSGE